MSMITLAIPDFSRTSILASTTNLYSHKNSSPFPISVRIMDCGGNGKELGLGVHSSSTSAEKNNTERVLGTDDAINEEGGTSDNAVYVARLAQLDEEYLAAAWLRAEAYWESIKQDYRHQNTNADDYKWLYARREFDALKHVCRFQFGNHCKCFIMIKKEEEKAKASVKNRVVGTLDLHLQYFPHPQTFSHGGTVTPRRAARATGAVADWKEIIMESQYAYLSNLCVAEAARRQGFATTMLKHAISTAHSLGFEKVYVRAYAYNEGAVRLYEKFGFKEVDAANLGQGHSSAHPLVFCLQLQPS